MDVQDYRAAKTRQRGRQEDRAAAFLSTSAFRCKRNRKAGGTQHLWVVLHVEERYAPIPRERTWRYA
jgi:hypothetical protein